MTRGKTTKNNLQKVTGSVTYIGKTFKNLPNRHHGKYRYITIENYPQVFELFVGKEKGDFAPEYEIIDSIKVSDELAIYFSEIGGENEPVNRLARFIDKNGKKHFVYGSYDVYWGIGGMITGCILLIVVFILWRMGKI